MDIEGYLCLSDFGSAKFNNNNQVFLFNSS